MFKLFNFKEKEQKEKKRIPKNLMNVEGASGTQIFDGYINEEYNSKLAGLQGLRTYDQMRASDATVNAAMLAMELPIRATEWRIEPGKTLQKDGTYETTEEDLEVAQFIEQALFEKMDMSFDDFLRQALTMLPFGFSVFEKVFKMQDNQILWSKFAQRLQTSIEKWETKEGEPGVTQVLPNGSFDVDNNPSIPAEKLLVFTYRKEGDNFEGRSVLRSAYKHRYIKDTLYKFDAVKFERHSVGIPKITLPASADDDDKKEAAMIAQNLRATAQSYIVLPNEEWQVEMMNLQTGSIADPTNAIAHHDRQIMKNILAQFIDLGTSTGSGSYALSEDQSSLFLLSLSGVAKQIAYQVNRFAIQELVDLNFFMGENQTYPQLTFNKLGDTEYDKLANSISTLITSGVIESDEALEVYMRSIMDLPNKVESEDEENDDNPKLKNKDKRIEEDERDDKKQIEASELQKMGFTDQEELDEMVEAKRIFNVVDILNTQNQKND